MATRTRNAGRSAFLSPEAIAFLKRRAQELAGIVLFLCGTVLTVAVIGYDSKDDVCLMKDSELGDGCMTDYLFKNIVAQKDLKGLATAGIVGLSPSG